MNSRLRLESCRHLCQCIPIAFAVLYIVLRTVLASARHTYTTNALLYVLEGRLMWRMMFLVF